MFQPLAKYELKLLGYRAYALLNNFISYDLTKSSVKRSIAWFLHSIPWPFIRVKHSCQTATVHQLKYIS